MSILVFDPTSVHATLFDRHADILAWIADSPDNDAESYPGPGWADSDYEPSADELALVHSNDHDSQPDPFAVECWAMLSADWYDAEAAFEEWEAEGGSR